MKKTLTKFMSGLMALVLALLSVQVASAAISASPLQAGATYYVSPTGNDVNACTLSAPCKTFNRAMGLAVAGDLVVALEGTYTQALTISKSGITVEGRNAVITASPHGIQVKSTAQNVTVRGFTVTGSVSHGIFVEGKSVTIENNTVYHTVLENGTLSDGSVTCANGAFGSAIKLGYGSSSVTVRNNTVYENCGEGIAATRSSYVVIEGNTVYDNKSVNIYVDNSFNVQVLNNTSYCVGVFPMGIALGEEYYSGWGAQLKDVTVAGNTVTNCYTGIMVFSSDVGGTLTNATIRDNYAPTAQRRGISLDNSANSNVLVANNTHFNDLWIRSTKGVTLTGNTKVSSSPTPTTSPATATPTSVPPTLTATPIAPTNTSTATPMPTYTQTPVPTSQPSETATEPAPSATPVTPAPTETPESTEPASATEVIYDNTADGFSYSPEWFDVAKKQAYMGSYKETNTNGASVTFTFTGQSFSVLYTAGPAFRNMDVYVDDVLVGSIDQRRESREHQQRWDYTGQFEPGEHTLKLVFVTPSAKLNTKGSVDAVIVR